MTGGASPARRGIAFERDTRRALEHAGYFVVRAAGSHGPADLVALRRDHVPYLVSCKLDGYLTPDERLGLLETAFIAGGWPILAAKEKRGRVSLYALHGNGKQPMYELPIPKRANHARESETVDGARTQ